MPAVIRAAVPVGTLPYSLSSKFSESRSVQMNMNEYHDGSCQRVSLVTGSRRTWKLPKRLDAFHLGLLRTFCNTVQGGAFNFYNPFETLPAFTKNPIGTAGLYLVRFNSDWSQINGMGRSDCDLEIIEVSATGAIDIGAPIVPDSGPGGAPAGLVQVPINPSVQGGQWLQFSFGQDNEAVVGYGPISYGGNLWAYGVASQFDIDPVSGNFGGAVYKSADGLTWTKQDGDRWFEQLPNATYWDKSSETITILLCDTAVQNSTFLGNLSGNLIDFHMDTGLYGEPTASVELVGSSPGHKQFLVATRLFKLSNGTYRVVYNVENHQVVTSPSFQETVTDSGIYYVDYIAGAWTSPVVIAGGSGNWYSPFYAVQDGDVINAVYEVREYPDGGVLSSGSILAVQRTGFRYVLIATDGSLSTPQTIDALPGTGTNEFPIWTLETGILSGDSIIIPAAKWEYPSGNRHTKMGVLVGTPKDNPTFTWAQFSMAPVPDDAGDPYDMKMIHLGSKDYLGWLHFKLTDPGVGQIYVVASSDQGVTWTTPLLLLDVAITPPPTAEGDTRYLYNISLGTQLDGTSLGLMYTSWATYWTNAPALLLT